MTAPALPVPPVPLPPPAWCQECHEPYPADQHPTCPDCRERRGAVFATEARA